MSVELGLGGAGEGCRHHARPFAVLVDEGLAHLVIHVPMVRSGGRATSGRTAHIR